MAKRYDYTKIKKNKAGDRVYETTMYPTVNLDENDIYIYSKDGDCTVAEIVNGSGGSMEDCDESDLEILEREH